MPKKQQTIHWRHICKILKKGDSWIQIEFSNKAVKEFIGSIETSIYCVILNLFKQNILEQMYWTWKNYSIQNPLGWMIPKGWNQS